MAAFLPPQSKSTYSVIYLPSAQIGSSVVMLPFNQRLTTVFVKGEVAFGSLPWGDRECYALCVLFPYYT